MLSTRTQIILTDFFLAAFIIAAHGMYLGAIALILGASLPVSLILGLVSGVLIRRMMKRSIDGERDRRGNRAREKHQARMATRRENPFRPAPD